MAAILTWIRRRILIYNKLSLIPQQVLLCFCQKGLYQYFSLDLKFDKLIDLKYFVDPGHAKIFFFPLNLIPTKR